MKLAMKIPSLPADTSTFLWGAAIGALALGWATMPGATGEPSIEVANACAEALVKM